MGRSFVPSIVPSGHHPTVYLVINNFRNLGTPETDIENTCLETVVGDLMSGQYTDPVGVVAFNTAEGWSAYASEDIAREIRPAPISAGESCRHRSRHSSRCMLDLRGNYHCD
jgi:hypothetical protein